MPKAPNPSGFYYRGFTRPTTTPVPDDVFDVIAPELTESELRVLLYIVRRTFGFKKDDDSISLTQMVKGITSRDGRVVDRGTGLSRQGVINGINGLLAKGVIEVTGAMDEEGVHEINSYRLRFEEGVVNEVDYGSLLGGQGVVNEVDYPSQPSRLGVVNPVDYGSQPSRLGVVNEVDQQQTVKQQTVKQQTVKQQPVFSAKNKMRDLLKIDDEKAAEISAQYSDAQIAEKLALLEWKLQNRTRGRPITDPLAWLMRALEQNTPLPPEARQAMASPPPQSGPPANGASPPRRKAEPLDKLRESYGTTAEEATLWAQILREIELSTTKGTFQSWFTQTAILALRHDRAVVAVPNPATQEWLMSRMAGVMHRAIGNVLGYDLELEFVVAGSDETSRSDRL